MTTPALQAPFLALLEEHRRILYKVANTYCWNPGDREDLIQEITVQLWRSFSGFDHRCRFSTWMYRIALNVAISHARSVGHRDRHTALLDDEALATIPDPVQPHEADERLRALRHVIDQLDGLNRALLLLYLDDRSHREIAEVLGISESNVATKISRLKQRVRQDPSLNPSA